jgi:uncharacterized membrane protein YhfC
LNIGTLIAFIFSLLLQVGYPLAVTLHYRRHTHARWQLFAYGAIIFAVFELFTWLPLSFYLDVVIGEQLTSEFAAFIWLLVMALLTSLIEELGRWWGYRYLFPRGSFPLTWRNGVMYSLGHGALETMLFMAGLTFVGLVAYLMLSSMDVPAITASAGGELPPALSAALQSIRSISWEQPLVVAWERVLALPHQLAWGLLVMQSLVYRQKRWFGYAVLYHFSVAVSVPGLARLAGFAVAEGLNLILAALSVWIIVRLRAVERAGE